MNPAATEAPATVAAPAESKPVVGTWSRARERGDLRLPETGRADRLATNEPERYAQIVAALRTGADRDKIAEQAETNSEMVQQVLDREGMPLYRERIRRNAAITLDRLLAKTAETGLDSKREGTSIKDLLIGSGILCDKLPSLLGEEAAAPQQHQVLRINLTASLDEVKAMLARPTSSTT